MHEHAHAKRHLMLLTNATVGVSMSTRPNFSPTFSPTRATPLSSRAARACSLHEHARRHREHHRRQPVVEPREGRRVPPDEVVVQVEGQDGERLVHEIALDGAEPVQDGVEGGDGLRSGG